MTEQTSATIIGLFVIFIIYKILKFMLDKTFIISAEEPIARLEGSSTLILNDLEYIIDKECRKTMDMELMFDVTRKVGEREMFPLANSAKIISDEQIDSLTTSISLRIIDNMSRSFIARLSTVIDEERIISYITDEVYYILYSKGIEVNLKLKK